MELKDWDTWKGQQRLQGGLVHVYKALHTVWRIVGIHQIKKKLGGGEACLKRHIVQIKHPKR